MYGPYPYFLAETLELHGNMVSFCRTLKCSDFNVLLSNFRYLSHKFHGKGPGKNKVEKRMKKNEQEGVSISPNLVISCCF
jgi:hypothetical protein